MNSWQSSAHLVRLGILVWSGGILTLNYVTIPGLPQQKIDPTFIAERVHWGFSLRSGFRRRRSLVMVL